MQRMRPQYVIIAAALLLVAVFLVPQLFTDQPGARSEGDGVITETIGVGKTNASVAYQVRLLEGTDPQHEADHVFEALAGLPGVGKASLNTERLELTVAYDDSVTSPSPIRERLVTSGYLVPNRDETTPTELAEDGSTQRISIRDDGSRFNPFLIRAQSGIPVEMEFSPGQECRVVVKFPEVGIEQNIAEGGTVVLPALTPGEYQITCSGDGNEGTLIVE